MSGSVSWIDRWEGWENTNISSNALASYMMRFISYTSSGDGDGRCSRAGKWVIQRVSAATMPVFLALSTVQIGCKLVCSMIQLIILQEHTLGKDLVMIKRLVVATLYSILLWPVFLYAPEIYKRRIEPLAQKREASVLPGRLETEQSIGTFPGERREKKGWEKFILSDLAKGWEGIRIDSIADPNFNIDDPNFFLQQFDSSKIKLPQIEYLDSFVYPRNSMIEELSAEFNENNFIPMFARNCQIDALRLVNRDDLLEGLLQIDGSQYPVIQNIKTLALQNFPSLSSAQLLEIGRKFPNIACLDLRGSNVQINSGDLEELYKRCIVVFNDNVNNAQQQLNQFNKYLIDMLKELKTSENFDFSRYFPVDFSYEKVSPAACFVRNLSFLRGLPLTDGDLQEVLPRIFLYMHSVVSIDLSACLNLSADSLLFLPKCIKLLYVRGCNNFAENILTFMVRLSNLIYRNKLRQIDMRFIRTEGIREVIIRDLVPEFSNLDKEFRCDFAEGDKWKEGNLITTGQ
jgi:hypothetical protein